MGERALDPVIHGESRLRIMAALRSLEDGDQITFTRIRDMLEMTSGNLSVHLRKLEDSAYVRQEKVVSRRGVTTYVSLTDAGRRAFDDYVRRLEALLRGSIE